MSEKKDNKPICNHEGAYGTVAQSIFYTGDQLLIICTQNCMRCGKLMTNINPVDLKITDMAGGNGIIRAGVHIPDLTKKP